MFQFDSQVRYCGRCWKERKGWLPDRPKPKHKKKAKEGGNGSSGSRNKNKNKRTEGQAVKSSTGKKGLTYVLDGEKTRDLIQLGKNPDLDLGIPQALGRYCSYCTSKI